MLILHFAECYFRGMNFRLGVVFIWIPPYIHGATLKLEVYQILFSFAQVVQAFAMEYLRTPLGVW